MNSFRSHPITARPSLIRRSITHPSAMAATAGPSMLPRFPQPVQPCRPGRPWPKLGLAANPSSNTPVVDALPPRARTRPPTAIKWRFSEHGPGVVAAATVPSKTSSRGRLQTHTNGNLVSAQHGIRPSHVSFAPPTIRMSPLFGSPFTPPPLPARPSSCRCWGRWISIKQPPRIPIFAVFLPLPYPSHSSLIFTHNPLNPLENLAAVCNLLAAAALISLLRVLSVVHCKKSAPFRHPR